MVELLIRQNLEAVDADSASSALRSVFGVGTAHVGPGGVLRYTQRSLVDDGITATRVTSSGANVRVTLTEAPDMVVIAVREGELTMTQGAESVVLAAHDLGLIPLDRSAEAAWDRVELDAYSFPRASIGRLLGTDARYVGVHVARLKSVSAAVNGLWARTAAVLSGDVLQNPELFESDVIREQAIDALLGVTIEAFGISDAMEGGADADGQLIRAAVLHMRGHLSEPISMPDVAAAVGISVRGLQLAFRSRGTETPLMTLRALRMREAHDAFTAPGAGRATTVGGIARGLGYTNLGRFSAHYREAWGETPTETLRGAARLP